MIIRIVEYKSTEIERDGLSPETAALIWRRHSKQVGVTVPSFQNGDRWQLTSLGWVGRIPIAPDLELHLEPKTSLGNLFAMLSYAYKLRSIEFPPGVTSAESLQEFYSQLARLLASWVLARSRKGFYHTYRTEEERLPFIRGRVDMAVAARQPWSPELPCHYHEHTADIDDNRILTWTLWKILRTGYCREWAASHVRKAYRTVQAVTELQPYDAQSCRDRTYQRLNQDYRPLHILCSFFLDNTGPTHKAGEHEMVPFLVDMAKLFELAVAEWLQAHISSEWEVVEHDRAYLDGTTDFLFDPDLIIRRSDTHEVRFVLDTKYKVHPKPEQADISQVITYAHLKRSPEAVLVYPGPLERTLDSPINGIRVRSAVFDLSRNIEEAGQSLLEKLGLAQGRQWTLSTNLQR